MKFFVLWLILGTDKFPYSNHKTLSECMKSGQQYVEKYNSNMEYKCVEWN